MARDDKLGNGDEYKDNPPPRGWGAGERLECLLIYHGKLICNLEKSLVLYVLNIPKKPMWDSEKLWFVCLSLQKPEKIVRMSVRLSLQGGIM